MLNGEDLIPMKTMLQNALNRSADSAIIGSVAPTTVLVPMLNLGLAPDMLELAATLAVGFSRSSSNDSRVSGQATPHVVVLGVVEVPEDQPLTMGLDMARSYRALLDFLPSEVEAGGRQVRVDHIVKVARNVASAVQQAAVDEQAGLVLFYWKGYSSRPKRYVYGHTLDSVLANPPCDVALVRPEGWRDSRRILLPVRGGASAEQALNLALNLGEQANLPLIVLHNVQTLPPKNAPGDAGDVNLGEEPYLAFTEHLEEARKSASVPVLSVLTLGDDPASALLQEAQSDDFIVMGMSAPHPAGTTKGEQRERDAANGSIPLIVSKEKGPPMMLLRTAERIDVADYTRKARSHRTKKSWEDMPFERWFVENTYNGDEFKDPDEFLKLKKAAGLSLSVALLTFNNARHIHSMITGLKRVLVEMHPIADQVAVIDAGSTDGTLDIARSLGVEVYSTGDILPEQGRMHGRGESWWKSLAVLRGDVIVWLDPRARRFHPTSVMSLAGPLLRMPSLQLVKAFGGMQIESSGANVGHEDDRAEVEDWTPDVNWGESIMPRREYGVPTRHIRVQALTPSDLSALSASQMAALPPRTILQVFYPALAGVITPFGSDMAGRREAMRAMPAFMGDNLEAGLLLSATTRYGVQAIAQVELRHARPTPPPHPSFHTAIEVLHVLSRRLDDPQMRRITSEIIHRLELEVEGRKATAPADPANVEVRALPPVERPPIDSVVSVERL